jgi:TolB-like protein/DNA-binding winged helix-turn-helix (wHTH) protein/Tfp pilus assembly protein PilF
MSEILAPHGCLVSQISWKAAVIFCVPSDSDRCDIFAASVDIMDVDLKLGFSLGDWEVQPLLGQIIGSSGAVHMEPKVMDVLVALASRPGEVIERDDLLNEVWGGRAVADEPLTRCIASLRRILNDSRVAPEYIETIPKRGYRLVAPVKAHAMSGRSRTSRRIAELWRRRQFRIGAAYAAVAILIVGLSIWFVLRPQDDPPIPATAVSLAVLPFANLSDDSGNEYFSDGLSEEIMTRLAGVEGLIVVARTSSFSFKESNDDAKTIARKLQVSHLLDGSVRKDGDRLRITAELIDSEGFRLWSDNYEGVLSDVFYLQDTIANDIVSQVRPSLKVTDTELPIETEPPTENLDAYELVLRGGFQLQRRNEGPLKRSISLFEKAIELDENYGDAYVGLATAYALLPFYSLEPRDAAFDLAMATIEKGANKDSSVDTKAAGIMSFMLFSGEWRWIESEIGFRRALAYSPDDAELLQWYSQFLGSVGRTEESLYHAMRAKELDQLSPVINHRLAIAYMWMNQNDLAREQYGLASELGMAPASNPEAYVIFLLRLAEYDEARLLMTGLQKMMGHSTDWIEPVLQAIQDPENRPAAVEAVIRAERENDISKQYLYGVWVYLNETDRALDIAHELIKDRPSFNTELLFAEETSALRQNPRFGDLIREIGLHRYWENFGWPEMCSPVGEQIVCY